MSSSALDFYENGRVDIVCAQAVESDVVDGRSEKQDLRGVIRGVRGARSEPLKQCPPNALRLPVNGVLPESLFRLTEFEILGLRGEVLSSDVSD